MSGHRIQDPVLELIKMHDLILSFLDKADEDWKNGRQYLLKAQRGIQRLSREKYNGIPQLEPLYRYFIELLLESQSGNKAAMYELRTYIVELRDTWIEARKRYRKACHQ